MERFNCKSLNETFNVVGIDYILIEEQEYNQNVAPTNIKKKTNLLIKKKPTILKVYRNKEKLYEKPIQKTFNYNDFIDELILTDISQKQREQSMIMHNANIEYSMLSYIPATPKKQKQKIQKVDKDATKYYYDFFKKPRLNASKFLGFIV
jgi:hypothetical protein